MQATWRDKVKATIDAVAAAGGNCREAAEALGVTRATVYNRLSSAKAIGMQAPALIGRGQPPRTKLRAKFNREAMDNRQAWEHYISSGRSDDEFRNWLIECEMPKLRQLVYKMGAKLAHIEFGELLSEGTLALIDCARRYDPSGGNSFWTFASQRAVGAMYDMARQSDPVGRLCRTRSKKRIAFAEQFTAAHGRPPSDEEIMAGLGWTRQFLAASHVPECNSIDSEVEVPGHHIFALKDLLAACDDGPDGAALTESFFREVCGGLPFDVQTMVYLYFVRGATMKNIGLAFGLSESRISQQMTMAKELIERRLIQQRAA